MTVAKFSELHVQMNLTLGELSEIVALLDLAGTQFPDGHEPSIIWEIGEMYVQMMQNLESDGDLGEFEPE